MTHSHRIHLFCRYAHITKQAPSGLQQIYQVTILPQQQPAIVKFTQLPYPEEVHVECANQHLAPELLGVYPMPGGFTQVYSLAQNSHACSISARLQRWSKKFALCDYHGNCQQQQSAYTPTTQSPSCSSWSPAASFCLLLLVTPAICSQRCLLCLCRWTCSCSQTHGRVWSMQPQLSLQIPN